MCLHIWLKMWKTHHQRLCPNKNGNRNLGKMRNSSASWLSIMLAKLLRISLPFCDFCDLILKASKNHYINSRSLDVPRLLWFSSWASARAHRLVQHGRPRHKWHRTSPSSGEMTKPIPCSATASGSEGQIVHWLKGKFMKVYRKSALLPPTKVKAASFTFLLKPMLGIRRWHHISISEVPRGPGIFPSNQGVLQLCVHAELWVDPQKSITDSLGITAVAPTWLWVKGTRIDPEIWSCFASWNVLLAFVGYEYHSFGWFDNFELFWFINWNGWNFAAMVWFIKHDG